MAERVLAQPERRYAVLITKEPESRSDLMLVVDAE
jgi:hypothetical protein